MIIQTLQTAPPAEMAQALERFEAQFTYPLGPGRCFHIWHGADYPRFFRAMGEAACFVAVREGRVVGVIGAAYRRLRLPHGVERPVVYLGDLKIDPAARGGRVLPRLARAVEQWVAGRAQAAFSVVMDGTPVIPSRYTGRLGIPLFRELAQVAVLRLPTAEAMPGGDPQWEGQRAPGEACYRRLSMDVHVALGGDPGERSEMEPLWFLAPDGLACGRLEDTRRAKRLITDDGVEMRSAHLSCFAYHNLRAGVQLLQVALRRAASRGFPALFVAVPASEAETFRQALQRQDVVVAPSTVFGAGLEPGLLWNINTAEI